MDRDQNPSNYELYSCTRERNLIKIDGSSSKVKILLPFLGLWEHALYSNLWHRVRSACHSGKRSNVGVPSWAPSSSKTRRCLSAAPEEYSPSLFRLERFCNFIHFPATRNGFLFILAISNLFLSLGCLILCCPQRYCSITVSCSLLRSQWSRKRRTWILLPL
jgi:hypothetical protein